MWKFRNPSKKKVTSLILCYVTWNWIKMGPSIWGLVWFNMGLIGSPVLACLFFLTQFFQISKYLRNLAGRRILEGHNAKFTSVWPVYFKSHGVSISLTRLSQRNTNLRLLFNIYKTRKKPSQPIIDKFRAISGILCVLCIFVVPYVKFY